MAPTFSKLKKIDNESKKEEVTVGYIAPEKFLRNEDSTPLRDKSPIKKAVRVGPAPKTFDEMKPSKKTRSFLQKTRSPQRTDPTTQKKLIDRLHKEGGDKAVKKELMARKASAQEE